TRSASPFTVSFRRTPQDDVHPVDPCTSRRSMSEWGASSPRPYPPSATSAVRGGGPAASYSSIRQASTSSARRLADHRPWWPREYARSSASSSSRSRSTGSVVTSDRVRTPLTGPDPVHLLGRQHEDLPVADLAGAGRLQDDVHHLL